MLKCPTKQLSGRKVAVAQIIPRNVLQRDGTEQR